MMNLGMIVVCIGINKMKLRATLLILTLATGMAHAEEDKMTLEEFNSMSSIFIQNVSKHKTDILIALTYPTSKYRLTKPVCELSINSNALLSFSESNKEQHSAKFYIEEGERDIELANVLMKEHSIECD